MAKQKDNIQDDLMPQEWDSIVTPLLMHGFAVQLVRRAAILVDQQLFEIIQNRGVVIGLDYVTFYPNQMISGSTDAQFNDAVIDLKGGGQDLLVNEMAERYIYSLDLGTDDETVIHTRLSGGQTLQSRLSLPAIGFAPETFMYAQLIAYYSTKRLNDWQKTIEYPAGTGLKRQDFKLGFDVTPAGPFFVEGTIPKNQGPIIGVSFLALGQSIGNLSLKFEVDGVEIVKDINCLRFSKLSQRDPFVLYYPFQAGSRFKATLDKQNLFLITNVNIQFAVTFYFDN